MADRKSRVDLEILHMEDRVGASEPSRKGDGRDKEGWLNTQDNVGPFREDFPKSDGHRRDGKAERRKEAPNPAHFGAKQQRTAQNFDARAGFTRIAQRRIRGGGAPARIMRRRRHHAHVKAILGQIGADLAGEPADADHFRSIIDPINQNFMFRSLARGGMMGLERMTPLETEAQFGTRLGHSPHQRGLTSVGSGKSSIRPSLG